MNPVRKEIDGSEFLAITFLGLINLYANNLDLILASEKTSLDLYAGLRSFYYQNLVKEVYNGNPPPIKQADSAGGAPEAVDEDDLFGDL